VARIELAGADLDLTIGFEQVVGLTPENLGLSARLVSPLDPALLARLPGGGGLGGRLVSVPAALPIVVTIEPPATGGLSFSGMTTIDVHTHALTFTAGCPLRLFSASLGGAFSDITQSMGMGSYRARGHTGGFSEFLVVADLRSVAAVADAKFAVLSTLLDELDAAMPAAVASELASLLAAAAASWAAGDPLAAIAELEAFDAVLRTASGSDVPDVWRSARDLVNVGGELRAAAATLRFSLTLAGSS
jgi:hypothetical protein